MRLPGITILVLVLGVSTARADRAAADAAMADGRYRDAAAAYGGAYHDTGDPALLREIAIAHQAAGDCKTSLVYFERYLTEARPDAAERATVRERIAICERAAGAPPPPPPPPPATTSRTTTHVSPPSLAKVVRHEPPPPPSEKVLRSYRGMMIGFDLALALTVVPMANVSEALPAVWGLAWVLGPAIIHGLNDNTYQSGTSLLRRLLLPPGGAIIGAYVFSGLDGCEGECWDFVIGGVLGAGAGMLTAMIADWAYARVAVDAPLVVPTVSVAEDHASFGLAGSF